MFGLNQTVLDGVKESLNLSASLSLSKDYPGYIYVYIFTGPVTTLRDLVVHVPIRSAALLTPWTVVTRRLSRKTTPASMMDTLTDR